jgi:hypothetical protein
MTGQTMEEIQLDAAAMEPPEPLQKATLILQQLQSGQYLRMLHRQLPYPLFASCQKLDVSYRHFAGRQTGQQISQQTEWIILFWRNDDPTTEKFCKQLRL